MKFVYIGEYPADGICKAWGCEFRPGDAVEIPPEYVARASNNRFFLKAEPSEAVTLAPEPEGKSADVTDSLPDLTKAELIDMADKAGVTIDKRWSASRIQQAILDAAAAIEQPS